MKKKTVVVFFTLSFLFVMQLLFWSCFSRITYINKDIKFGFIDNQFVLAVSTRTGILDAILGQSTILSKRESLLRLSLIENRVMYNKNSIPSHFPKNDRGRIQDFMPEDIQRMMLNGDFEKLSREERLSIINKYYLVFLYRLYLKEICNEKDNYAVITFFSDVDVELPEIEYSTLLRNIFTIKNTDAYYEYFLSNIALGKFKIKDKMAKNIEKDSIPLKNPIPLDFSRTNDYEFYFVNTSGEEETKMEPLSSVELKNCRPL